MNSLIGGVFILQALLTRSEFHFLNETLTLEQMLDLSGIATTKEKVKEITIGDAVSIIEVNLSANVSPKLVVCKSKDHVLFVFITNETANMNTEISELMMKLNDKTASQLLTINTKEDLVRILVKKESLGTQIYNHLMHGVFNMLPFVVGGGILIALSFFWGVNSSDITSSDYNEFAWMLNFIGSSNAFYLMVPVLAGFIASSIAGSPGFAPGMVGGLLAITYTGGADANSGFLGGLIAGFLAGYIVLLLKKLFEKLPTSLDGLKNILFYPVFGIGIIGILMILINPWLIQIYTALTSFLEGMNGANSIILGMVIGGMMTVDMGGPMNKAAYTFGLAMLEANNFGIMAAVMAGGMVPPLASGLATTFFKNRFNKQEREAGKTAYVLGACFITEGAIPFAAADPLRAIPSFVLGSAVAGGLTMFFEIQSRAPHGGIFVIGLVDGGLTKAGLYIVAILTGAIVAAVSMGLLKKKIHE